MGARWTRNEGELTLKSFYLVYFSRISSIVRKQEHFDVQHSMHRINAKLLLVIFLVK